MGIVLSKNRQIVKANGNSLETNVKTPRFEDQACLPAAALFLPYYLGQKVLTVKQLAEAFGGLQERGLTMTGLCSRLCHRHIS
jgi:hypothetical protein